MEDRREEREQKDRTYAEWPSEDLFYFIQRPVVTIRMLLNRFIFYKIMAAI